jgi:GAF domain
MESDTYFEDLVHRVQESVNCETVSLYLFDEAARSLTLTAAVGYPKELIGADQYQVEEGITGWVTRTGKLLITDSQQQVESPSAQKDKYNVRQYSNPMLNSLMSIPLKTKEGNVIGILKAENKKTADHSFSEADLDAMKWFAETAVTALKLRRKNHRKIYTFVLMPFDSSFEDIYKYGIKKPIEDLGITCERVDEIQYVGGIFNKVVESIERARFIVADMTGRNPNVFYEVGYCHALRKDVILCTQTENDIPFDLRGYNHIVYGGKIALLEAALRKRISSLMDEKE